MLECWECSYVFVHEIGRLFPNEQSPGARGFGKVSKMTTGIVLLLFLLPWHSNATTLIDQGYRDMYNLDFADAHRCFTQWERTHPDNPLAPASDAAAYLFHEFDQLRILQSEFFVDDNEFLHKKRTPDPAIKDAFDNAVKQSQQLAEHRLMQCPNDETALFANVLRLGLQADYLALTSDSPEGPVPPALRRAVTRRSALRDKNEATARKLLSDLAKCFPQNHLYREELAKLQ